MNIARNICFALFSAGPFFVNKIKLKPFVTITISQNLSNFLLTKIDFLLFQQYSLKMSIQMPQMDKS
jgi:hypothetical protein